MHEIIRLSKKDNIAVTPKDIPKNIIVNENNITTKTIIPKDHKIAIKKILKGDELLRFETLIGGILVMASLLLFSIFHFKKLN